MKNLNAALVDAWGAFFKEAGARKSRALRLDVAIILFTPIPIYFIIKYMYIGLKYLFTTAAKQLNVDLNDSLQGIQSLIHIIKEINNIAGKWLMLALAIYLGLSIMSLIVRRFFDMGVPYKIANHITNIWTLFVVYTQVPAIISFLNKMQSFYIIPKITLPLMTPIATGVTIITMYLIVQLIPSNYFTLTMKKHN